MLLGMDHALRLYNNPEITRREIIKAMENYKGLNWKVEPFVFNDGTSRDLVNLQGTIPVNYKGSVYNIPICIWLMDTHPDTPPICYVKPTPDMQIKMSMYVDHSGKIYLPYLHDWHRSSSDLLGLIIVMICAFGEYPPVFARPRTDSTPYPTQPSYMPMPGSCYPAYPATPTPTQYPQPQYGNTPYPQMPPTPLRPPPTPTQHYMPQASPPAVPSGNSGTITDAHIRESLMSALEHKIKQRLQEHLGQSKAELDILQHTANELTHGKAKLDAIIEKLKKEKLELERTINVLKEKDAELDKAIAEIGEQGEVDVDEAVTTTTPLYKQILNTYAEEAALEDTIYYIGEALRRGVIDLDVFLKQIRTLSRKQFMLRALMQKCRQKAGLAC
ncbi:unnamed protein product [Nezara viridula]|uniref:Tumor susceptibility gene 101 protein n=1 Tax=Nezara viridula TaxID=85310 RepID=A0A9P0E853_NEZVI|nr:unnamed protein product [Nezara viridula]